METGEVQLQLEFPEAGLNWQDIDFAFFQNTRQGDMQIRPDEGEPLSCAQCRQTTTCGLETSLSPVTQCPEEMLKSVALKVFSQPPFLYLPVKGGGGNRVY